MSNVDLEGIRTWSEAVRALRGSSKVVALAPSASWTGEEVWARGAGAADWLDAIGAPTGHPVPALVSTGLAAVALLVGGAHSARPLALIGPRSATRELAAVLARYESSPVVIVDAEHVDAARAAAQPWQHVEAVPELPRSSRALDETPDENDVIVVLHTSGTSGVPKAVAMTQRGMVSRLRATVAVNRAGSDSVYCTMSPFQHMAGVGNVLVMLACGGTIALSPAFGASSWDWLGTIGTTHALLVPTMIDRLLDEGGLALPDLQVLTYGAAPIHPDTLVALQQALPDVGLVQAYGMTEGSPITCLTIDDHRAAAAGDTVAKERLRSAGRAAAGIELEIREPDAGGVGEVLFRGAHALAPEADGWVHSGDIGRLDDGGYLFLVGRRADRIVRGGENVEALEVEDVLASHPMVRAAGVVGVPDRRWGELVKAFVVATDPEAPPATEDLRAHARARLAGFKVPTEWAFVDDLPRTETGKLLRRRLRELT